MNDLNNQIERLRSDLAQRRAELARLDLLPQQRAKLPPMEAANVVKMQVRLRGEIAEVERYMPRWRN